MPTRRIYFNGLDTSGAQQLWTTDGTAAGTSEISPAGGYIYGVNPQDITSLSATILFNGLDTGGLAQLWATNGTVAGTTLLTVKGAASTGLAPADITAFGTGALFQGVDASGSTQLWVTDGTGGGTVELVPAQGALTGTDPVSITVLGSNVAVFNGLDANSLPQLFVTDGTPAGTKAVAVAGADGAGLNPVDLTPYRTGALFFGLDQTGSEALWLTNGSATTTTELAAEPGAGATGFTLVAGLALFEDGTQQLAVTNGTGSGTQELAVAGASGAGLQPTDITAFGTRALFSGVDQAGLTTLWITDGTQAGTKELSAPSSLAPSDITVFGAKALFNGTDSAGAPQLWITDGTMAGTTEILPAGASTTGLAPAGITVIGTQALFNGTDSSGRQQLWTTDGTAAGTSPVNPANGNAAGLSPTDLTPGPVPATLVIAAPPAATVGTGKPGAITPVSVTETGAPAGEVVTVTLTDTTGVFAASGGTALTLVGTVAQVNAALAGLTVTEPAPGADTITIDAVDRLGTHANTASTAVTVNGLPVIGAPALATIPAGPATPIGPVSLTENGNTTGENFTVTLADSNGLLSATGPGVTGAGTASLTVSGTLAQVNAALATLKDTDGVAAPDTIRVRATDGFGNAALAQTIAVGVNGRPTVSAPGAIAAGVGQPKAVTGVSLAETGAFAGETFAVTLGDTAGTLTATGPGTTGSGTKNLLITGSLAQVNADLATLGFVSGTTGQDTITLNASDSLFNTAAPGSVAVTVSGAPVVATPAGVSVNQAQASPVKGISVSEASVNVSETFTVVVSDAAGLLSAKGATGAGTTSLQISGSLAQVNAALATLTDTDASAARDIIAVSATDSFGNAGSASVPVTVITIRPSTIMGTTPGQATTDEQTVKPFAKVQINDPNPGPTTETVTITPTTLANGTLSDPTAATDGATITNGVFKITGAAAAVAAVIDGLVFTPLAHEVSPGGSVTTGFTISDANSVGLTTFDAATTVTATAVNDAPTITGAKVGQATVDYVPVKPFATVTVADVDIGVTDSLTIALKNVAGAVTDANGTLAGAGLTKTGAGTYSLATASPAALTSALQQVTFVPTQHEAAAGQIVTTGFTLTASQAAGGTTATATTTNATTSVAVTALNYITGPASGFAVLCGTPGADVILAQGSFNTILSNGGNDFINAGAGHAFVDAGCGNDSVTLGGAFNIVVGGDGTDTVTGAPGGYTAVTLGNGADTVQIGGTYDGIKLGNGGDSVSGTQGMAFISTGSGNDTIVLGGSGSLVDAGGGTNSITGGTGSDTFVAPLAGAGFDLIKNFTLTNGDVLNLAASLAATSWDHRTATLGNYLKVTSGGGNTTLSVATSGSGAGVAILQLSSAGSLQLPDLINHGSLQL